MPSPAARPRYSPVAPTRPAVCCRVSQSGKHQRAFSLVEVVLALGIVSFAMVSLMGMIPLGLGTLRDAMNATVETQIVQSIENDLFLTNYSKLTGRTAGFDADGVEVPLTSLNVFYTAVISTCDTNTPASLSGTAAATYLIRITSRTSPQVVHSYPMIIANNRL